MKRSSPGNPPRVGMVVRWARGPAYSCPVPPGRQFEISTDEKRAFDTIKAHGEEWSRGQYDIISEPPSSTARHCSRCGTSEQNEDAVRCRAAGCGGGFLAIGATGGDSSPDTKFPVCSRFGCLEKHLGYDLCNCSQALALADALRRIVASINGDAPALTRTEINLIAREALK